MKQAQRFRKAANFSLVASVLWQIANLAGDTFWYGSFAMLLLVTSLVLHSWSADLFERELHWQRVQNKILHTSLENEHGLKVEIERQHQK